MVYNGMTSLDFVGVYDPLTRLKTMGFATDLSWEICSFQGDVTDSTGLRITPTKIGGSFEGYDMMVVPGGLGSRELLQNQKFIEWLRSSSGCKFKVSVCTGSLLLGASGFLRGRKATTHRTAFNDLKQFCATVVDERIVDEGEIITARGVTSSIDLGLYLCERFFGHEVKEKIRLQMDYCPSPDPSC